MSQIEIVDTSGMPRRLGDRGPDRDSAERARHLQDAFNAFLMNKPKRTRDTYLVGLKQFFGLVAPKRIDQITMTDAATYKQWLIEHGYAKSTICGRLAAVDGLFTFLTQQLRDDGTQMLSRNPFDVVTRRDVLPTPFISAVPVEKGDFHKMIDALPADRVGLRDRAVLLFLAHTGRRRSEVARLLLGDLDLTKKPYEYTVEVKGGGKKKFELPDEAYDAMRQHWVSARRLGKLTAESAVFGDAGLVGEDSEAPLHHRTIWEIVKRAAKKAGVDHTRVKPHGFRHMYARILDEGGTRLQVIQRSLGHESSATTDGYLDQLRSPPQVQGTVRRALQRT
jgi:site-specific recombinase XerD